MVIIKQSITFIWDKGNKDKSWLKHKITNQESEEVFFDKSKRIYFDKKHSLKEKRHILLGKTKRNKLLYIVFTVRNKKIRIISARKLNRKEKKLYEKTT